MKRSFLTGISFGITSGIITTLGLIVGLNSGTGLKLAVIGGILSIAISDAFGDALGIYVSEESDKKNKYAEINESAFATFIAKLFAALSFVIPMFFFDLGIAVLIDIVWGLLLVGIFSYFIAKTRNENPFNVVFKHLVITIVVIIITNYSGVLIAKFFGNF